MAKQATAPATTTAAQVKKKKKIHIDVTGKAFVKATFNNVVVTMTDVYGNVISWSSDESSSFRSSEKLLSSLLIGA